jgi:WD40-like Beta Propeller Repeat
MRENMRRSAVTLPALVAALLLTACASRPRQDGPELAPTRTLAPPATRRPVTATSQPTATAAVTATAVVAVADLEGCAQRKPDLKVVTPALPEVAGRVMYLSVEGNLELNNVTGSARERITTDAYIDRENRTLRSYQFPAASPDGSKLAFVRLEVGGGGFTQTLQVADARDGARPLDLYESNGFNMPYVDWSPDGKTIAFLTIGGQSGAIRAVAHTGGPVGAVEIGAPTYWHWRADSSGMVTHLGGRAEQAGGAAFMSIVAMNGSKRIDGSTAIFNHRTFRRMARMCFMRPTSAVRTCWCWAMPKARRCARWRAWRMAPFSPGRPMARIWR